MTPMSHHDFKGAEKIAKQDIDRMVQAALSYKFRWKQFNEGVIERVEGCDFGTGDYADKTDEKNLYPLGVYDKKYEENIFAKDYKKLK